MFLSRTKVKALQRPMENDNSTFSLTNLKINPISCTVVYFSISNFTILIFKAVDFAFGPIPKTYLRQTEMKPSFCTALC